MSTTFMDGPAAGQGLALRRAPALLRVVHSDERGWDALDQLDDQPEQDETITVYRLARDLGRAHLCYRGKLRHLSGWYHAAVYRHHDRQPEQAELRDTDRWRAWAAGEFARLTAPVTR